MPDATLALEDSPATGRRATLPFAAIAPTDLLSANRPAPSSPTSPAAASEPRNHYLDLLWADERQAAPLRLAFRELLESLDPEHSPQDGLRGDVLDIMSLATFEDARQLLARSSSSARRFVPPWLVAAGSLRVHPDPAEMLRCTHALLQVSPQAGKQELSALAVVQPHLDPALLGLDGLAARLLQYLEQSYAGADKHAAFASAREVVVRTLMLQRTFSKMVLLGERRVMAALHHADSAIGLCIAEDAALSLPPCEVFDAVVIGQVHPPQHDGEPLLCAHAIARRHALTAA